MYPSSNYHKQAVDEFGNHNKYPAGFVVDHGVEPHFIQEFKRRDSRWCQHHWTSPHPATCLRDYALPALQHSTVQTRVQAQ
jgi:hypothetical protein